MLSDCVFVTARWKSEIGWWCTQGIISQDQTRTANFHYRRRLPDAVRRAGEGGGREKGPAELIYQSLSCDFTRGKTRRVPKTKGSPCENPGKLVLTPPGSILSSCASTFSVRDHTVCIVFSVHRPLRDPRSAAGVPVAPRRPRGTACTSHQSTVPRQCTRTVTVGCVGGCPGGGGREGGRSIGRSLGVHTNGAQGKHQKAAANLASDPG